MQGIYRADLLTDRFSCCDKMDLRPIECNLCSRIMVFCANCEMLFRDLRDLNDKTIIKQPSKPPLVKYNCPGCDRAFEFGFSENVKYRAKRSSFEAQGFSAFLRHWIEGLDLKGEHFRCCCGYEDLLPLQCPNCHHIVVECLECSTLYEDLRDTSRQSSIHPNGVKKCPKCLHPYRDRYFELEEYRVTREDFRSQGISGVLRMP